MKHKHYDLIMAWANGEEIQLKTPHNGWTSVSAPYWNPEADYRIKPKEPVVVGCSVSNWTFGHRMPNLVWNTEMYANKIKLSFDPETGILLTVEKI